MTDLITLIVILGALAVPILVSLLPRHPTMAEEEAQLREYFRKRDAADARGVLYPPWDEDKPDATPLPWYCIPPGHQRKP